MTLYLIPTPINPEFNLNELTPQSVFIIQKIKIFFAENAKNARKFLKTINHPTPIQEILIFEIGRDNHLEEFNKLITENTNADIGLLSEAGCPVVADPGCVIIKHAHNKRITVRSLAGSSSITHALMLSGFGGQNFAFHGYLPHSPLEKIDLLRRFVNRAYLEDETQIFIETPYRTMSLINFFVDEKTTLPKKTNIGGMNYENSNNKRKTNFRQLFFSVCANILTDKELILTKPIAEWQPADAIIFKDYPSVFLLAYGN